MGTCAEHNALNCRYRGKEHAGSLLFTIDIHSGISVVESEVNLDMIRFTRLVIKNLAIAGTTLGTELSIGCEVKAGTGCALVIHKLDEKIAMVVLFSHDIKLHAKLACGRNLAFHLGYIKWVLVSQSQPSVAILLLQ